MDEHLRDNLAMWNELVPIHVASDFYDVPGFLAGTSHLRSFERPEIGDVAGRSLLHLQCHIGLDTLSWAREGAIVTGLDFSEPAIKAADKIAGEAGLDATFTCAEVHDAPEVLGRRYDIVYTGIGALCWLPDIRAWAKVVARLVEPGGVFYLTEVHPFTDIFADDDLVVNEHYFDRGIAYVDERGGTYAGEDVKTACNVDHSWTHPVSSVISALMEEGFVLESFNEHEFTVFRQFKALEHHPEDRTYRFPEGHPRLPLMYSIRCRMPDEG